MAEYAEKAAGGCGTSGMKAAMNGVLNFSVLDAGGTSTVCTV